MPRRFQSVTAIILSLSTFLFWSPVLAIGIGSGTIGPIGIGSSQGSFNRERVELTQRDGALIGMPSDGPIKLIVVQSPAQPMTQVILRWVERKHDRQVIALATTNNFSENPPEIHLYLSPDLAGHVLYEAIDGGWVRSASAPGNKDVAWLVGLEGPENDLRGFSVKGAGPFWLVDTAVPENSGLVDRPIFASTSPLIAGNLPRGFVNWAVPLLLMGFAVFVSRARFRNEGRDI